MSLAVIFVILGIFFAGLVPLWESPDEPSHFSHAYYLFQHRSLPRPGSTLFDQVQLYEAHHPPLYYLISACFLTIWDRVGLSSAVQITPNPEVRCTPEKNHFEHEDGTGWFRGPVSAYAVRCVSLILACMGPVFTALLAYRLFPQRPAVAALGFILHGFVPQFLFISASINNDCLAQTLSASVLYVFCASLLHERTSWFAGLGAGFLIAAGIATKASGLVWVPLAVGAVLGLRGNRLRNLGLLLAPLVISMLILFFVTSFKHGGGGLPELLLRRLFHPQGPAFRFGSLGTLPESLWACFGWVDIQPSPRTNPRVTAVAVLLLCVGWLSLWRNGELRRGRRGPFVLLVALPLMFLVSIGFYATPHGGAQGRFLFPVFGAFAIVAAYALAEMAGPLGKRGPWVVAAILAVLLACVNLWCVYRVILPAYEYQLPSTLTLGTRQCDSNAVTFPVVPLQEQGQAFVASRDGLTRIDVRLATHRRRNTGQLHLQLCQGMPPETTAPIRTVVADASSVRDNEYHAFEFEPVAHSAGRRFYFYLEAPGASAVNAVSVRMYDRALPGDRGFGSRFRRHMPQPGVLCFTSYHAVAFGKSG